MSELNIRKKCNIVHEDNLMFAIISSRFYGVRNNQLYHDSTSSALSKSEDFITSNDHYKITS